MTNILCLLMALSLALPTAVKCQWRRLAAVVLLCMFWALVWCSFLWTPPPSYVLTAGDGTALLALLAGLLCVAGIVSAVSVTIAKRRRFSRLRDRLKPFQSKLADLYMDLLTLQDEELGFELLALRNNVLSPSLSSSALAVSSRSNHELAWHHLDRAIDLFCTTKTRLESRRPVGAPVELENEIDQLSCLCERAEYRTAESRDCLKQLRSRHCQLQSQ